METDSTEQPVSATGNLSMAELAALEFEAWAGNPMDDCPLPTNEEWGRLADPHLLTLRLSWAVMFKTKAELIMMLDELGDDAISELFEQIAQSREWFEGLMNLYETAHTRLTIAGAVVIEGATECGAGT